MIIEKMKWKLKLIITSFALCSMISCKQTTSVKTMNPSGFEIKRGVNLSHWLSQDFGWAPKYTYINEKDLKFIDSIGYDHVRIPIDEMEMWNTIGKPNEVAFNCLTNCLDWCAKYNLKAIVDLHIIRSHHFNASNEGGNNTLWTDTVAQQNLINLWLELSERLHKYPNNMVAYEILNEAVAPVHEDWNKLLNKAIAGIRKLEPERVLILGGNIWQIPENLQYIKFPEDDRNIILSFHTYQPMAFTHYTADWVPVKDYKGKVHYPGQIVSDPDYVKFVDSNNLPLVNQIADARQIYSKQTLYNIYKPAIDFAKLKNLQLYCGEFGCLPSVERKDRLQYYKDIVTTFEENNIAWCNWEYKGDFGIYFFNLENKKSLNPDFELINTLLQNPNAK
jgi:endoglucanase